MEGFIQSPYAWQMAFCGGMVVLFALMTVLWWKFARLKKRYENMMGQLSNPLLEKNLLDYYQGVKKSQKEIEQLAKQVKTHEGLLSHCLQKIGVVRYNAFENTGSAQSFVIALLDGKHNGVVINSVFSRGTSAMFSKPIVRGNCNHHLSEEEKEALKIAFNSQSMEQSE